MEKINCLNCQNTNISSNANFCGKCGSKLSCECGQVYQLNDEFCQNCGKPKEIVEHTDSNNRNRFIYSEDSDGRRMEADLSDSATKDLADTLRDVLVANQLGKGIASSSTEGTIEIEDATIHEEDGEKSSSADEKQNLNKNDEKVNYPSLQSVVMKNLPASETEWIVVYSFYASNYGKKIFTRQDIKDKYEESNRKTTNRISNLSKYLKRTVQSGAINPINSDGEFSLLDEGFKKALEIIQRTKSSPVKSTSSSNATKSTSTSGTKSPKRAKKGFEVLDLGINESSRQKLREFYEEKSPKSQEDLVMVLAYWLKSEASVQEFGVNEIYTAIQIVGAKTPATLDQVIRNIKQSGKVVKDKSSKKFKLNHVGDDFVKFNLPKNKKVNG